MQKQKQKSFVSFLSDAILQKICINHDVISHNLFLSIVKKGSNTLRDNVIFMVATAFKPYNNKRQLYLIELCEFIKDDFGQKSGIKRRICFVSGSKAKVNDVYVVWLSNENPQLIENATFLFNLTRKNKSAKSLFNRMKIRKHKMPKGNLDSIIGKILYLDENYRNNVRAICQNTKNKEPIWQKYKNKHKNNFLESFDYIIGVLIKKDENFIVRSLRNEREIPHSLSQKSLAQLPRYAILKFDLQFNLVEVIGSLCDCKIDEKLSMIMNAYKETRFSRQAMQDAKNSIKSLENMQANRFYDITQKVNFQTDIRYDLTHIPFCTVDPNGAKDHDDAIYYNHQRGILYVAIADVSEYVLDNTNLDFIASNRAFSLYFPNRVIPMLPSLLSSNHCSLRPNEKRLVMVWEMKLDRRNCAIIKSRVFKAIIMSKANLTYDKVDKILQYSKQFPTKNPYSRFNTINRKVLDSICNFNLVAQRIRKKRLEKGFAINIRDFSIKLDRECNIKNIAINKISNSHTIVEEAMLLANKESARLMNELQYGIYRNHACISNRDFARLMGILGDLGYEKTELKKIKKGKKLRQIKEEMFLHLKKVQKSAAKNGEGELIDYLIIKYFLKATYDNHNIGHFGLGFETYTHFTSPIRRYCDLMVHKIISAYLYGNEKTIKYLIEKFSPSISHINAVEKQFSEIESFFMRLKMLRYAESKIPFKERIFITNTNNCLYGSPIDNIGYCQVRIMRQNNPDIQIKLHSIVEVTIINVDLVNMRLEAVL